MWETWVQSLGQEDILEKEMAIHSSILAWKIPWTTEEPGRLQSIGYSPRVRHDWAGWFSSSSSIPAGKIPLTEEPGRLWCPKIVRHDWACTHANIFKMNIQCVKHWKWTEKLNIGHWRKKKRVDGMNSAFPWKCWGYLVINWALRALTFFPSSFSPSSPYFLPF